MVTLKEGRICIYYKEHIFLIKRDDICTLDNCLVTEPVFIVPQVRAIISTHNLIYF